MKGVIPILLMVAFAGMAVFSIFLMVADAMAGHDGCLAELANGGTCPSGNPFSYLAFHFDAFKLFSTAIFTSGLVILFIVLAFSFGLPKLTDPKTNASIYWRYSKNLNFAAPPFKKQLIRWLALHKNSPSF